MRRKGEWGALLNVYLMITVNALFHGIIINEYYPHLFSVCVREVFTDKPHVSRVPQSYQSGLNDRVHLFF